MKEKSKKKLKYQNKQKTYETKDYSNWKYLLKRRIGKNDIIWGVGGKGVMLLNLLRLDYLTMPKVIDVNTNLNHKYIPITGNQIVAPSEIDFRDVDTVHVSNILYLEEITSNLEKYQHIKIKQLIK